MPPKKKQTGAIKDVQPLSLAKDAQLIHALRGSVPPPKKRARPSTSSVVVDVDDDGNNLLKYIIAVDEAGRGCCAGPVCITAVCYCVRPTAQRKDQTQRPSVPPSSEMMVEDSKAMTVAQREKSFDLLCCALHLPWTAPGVLEESVFERSTLDNSRAEEDTLSYFNRTFAATVVDAQSEGPIALSTVLVPPLEIDRINILNATLEGMAEACFNVVRTLHEGGANGSGSWLSSNGWPDMNQDNTVIVIDGPHRPWCFLSHEKKEETRRKAKQEEAKIAAAAEAEGKGGDVSSCKRVHLHRIGKSFDDVVSGVGPLHSIPCYAVIKGDALYYSIAVASIFSKVIRDRFVDTVLDRRYPLYEFAHHKGYCTREHKAAIHSYGPLPGIHRVSYGPVSGKK